jgi:predicted transcriptional regulator
MKGLPRAGMSDAERDIMQCLWEEGPGTVREVQERMAARGPDWTRSTVITLLQRLEAKGYVSSDRSAHAFVFHAAVSREDFVQQRVQELADQLAGGRAASLLLAFAQRQRLSAQEIHELQQLIDQMSKRSTRPSRS